MQNFWQWQYKVNKMAFCFFRLQYFAIQPILGAEQRIFFRVSRNPQSFQLSSRLSACGRLKESSPRLTITSPLVNVGHVPVSGIIREANFPIKSYLVPTGSDPGWKQSWCGRVSFRFVTPGQARNHCNIFIISCIDMITQVTKEWLTSNYTDFLFARLITVSRNTLSSPGIRTQDLSDEN